MLQRSQWHDGHRHGADRRHPAPAHANGVLCCATPSTSQMLRLASCPRLFSSSLPGAEEQRTIYSFPRRFLNMRSVVKFHILKPLRAEGQCLSAIPVTLAK